MPPALSLYKILTVCSFWRIIILNWNSSVPKIMLDFRLVNLQIIGQMLSIRTVCKNFIQKSSLDRGVKPQISFEVKLSALNVAQKLRI